MTLEETLNLYGSKKEPFFFCISFDMTKWEVHNLKDLPKDIKYEINDNLEKSTKKSLLEKTPVSKIDYKDKFLKIQNEIENGNTYLTNLTSQTKIKTKLSLLELFENSNAKFKLYFRDKFICFSPERFIKCKDNQISTYPMKGTIDASIPNAQEKILEDIKEKAEHTMVVDLLRNDLSIVSSNVQVKKFRYCETIDAGDKELLQVSSEITGDLENDWQKNIGTIITSILPAGSISGTPKKQTLKIIDKIEEYDRDFFTGIFGIFDGQTLDSAVMIRFIEQNNNKNLIYKSGGGITSDSNIDNEYNEMIDKVYIP